MKTVKYIRREPLKSALYLRLKKRKVFKTCPVYTYKKLRKQFRDTQRVPFMLDKTRKALFLKLGTRKTFFEMKNNSDFFLLENVAQCRKNRKGDTLVSST